MGDRRRWTALAMVAAVTLGTGAAAACGDDDGGRPSAESEPGDEQIRSTLDDVWSAIGADPESVDIAEYAYTFAPSNTACGDLPEDHRWFGERGSSASDPALTQAGTADVLVRHLANDGWEVLPYRYADAAAPPDVQVVVAVRDEMTVIAYPSEGYAQVNVRSGPCAPAFATVDPERYTPAS